MNNDYAKAYTEVIEILKYLPKEEYDKISEDKIEFLKENMDRDYSFSINPEKDLAEQNVSLKANTILVDIYQEFFATEEQKIMINKMLDQNQELEEKEKREKYNPDNIFNENKSEIKIDKIEIEDTKIIEKTEALVEYKESFFTKLKKFIFRFLHIKSE